MSLLVQIRRKKIKRFFFGFVLHVCTQVGEASGAYLPGG